MNRNSTTRLILIILFITALYGCDRPQSTSEEFQEIDTSQDPTQTSYTSNEPVIIETKDGKFTIKPVTEYKVSAIVTRKKSYSDGWQSKIAPFDLVLVWGRLAEPEYDKFIAYTQSDRWYFFEYEAGSPFNTSYVYAHSSNNHIIPANDNIYRAITSIKKRQKVILKGFLVNLRGNNEGQNVWWNTSLSRKDSGDGSCELFYVERIRIGDRVYE